MKPSPALFAGFSVLALAALVAVASIDPANAGDVAALPCPGCLLAPPGAGEPPDGANDPFLTLYWSLGLRGGIVRDSDGTHYEVLALPSLSMSQQTLRGSYGVSGSAEISKTEDGDVRIDDAKLDGEASYAFDALTTASLAASIETSQEAPNASDLGNDVASAPVVNAASATASLSRDFGGLEAALRVGANRSEHGDTILNDGSHQDNADLNFTDLDAGGRATLHLTPVLSAFLDGEATWESYDVASPSLLVKRDNRTYTAKAGLSGKWGELLALEADIGLAHRDFLDPTLTDVDLVVYDASLAYHPNETLALSADLSASLEPPDPDCNCTATVSRAASANVSYLVNPWLRLRGSIGATRSVTEGTSKKESGWNAGAGADYLLNAHTDLTADYSYKQSRTGSDPAEASQTLMLGVTYHR